MVKIDLKDKKILNALDDDSRRPLAKIGREVRLPKNVVAYRIQRLQEEGIIKNFYTVIDAAKLGYISIRLYLVFQNATPKIREELIRYFVQSPHTFFVASAEGRFDLAIILWVRKVNDFYAFWEQTLRQYRNYFKDQQLSLFYQLQSYRYSYILGDTKNRGHFEVTGGSKSAESDEFDFRILQQLASNARMPITLIAKTLKTTIAVVDYRIKRLRKLGII